MIPYFAKHFAKQFIWGKPIGCGGFTKCGHHVQKKDIYFPLISIWVQKKQQAIDTVSNIGLGGNVLNSIAKANLPSNNYHVLLFDNYFTSSSHGYLTTGTCRNNRSDKYPISEKNFLKHQPQGAVDCSMSGDILLMKWKDNKEVTVMSNFDPMIIKFVQH